jgi:glycopeptide antibiotics resistance protein
MRVTPRRPAWPATDERPWLESVYGGTLTRSRDLDHQTIGGGVPSIAGLQVELGRVGFTLAVVVILVVGLLTLASFRRRGALRTAGLGARVGFGVVIAGVLSLTLFGWVAPSDAERVLILDPVEGAWGWDSIAWRPVYDNVILFVPVGALAAAVWWRRSPVLVWLACVGFSASIEAFQYLVPTGRVANMADLLANALGALVGIGLASWLGVRTAPRRARRTRRADSYA